MVALKGAVGDAGDGEKAQRGGNLNLAARSGVAGDDGLARDLLVRELGTHGLGNGRNLDAARLGGHRLHGNRA